MATTLWLVEISPDRFVGKSSKYGHYTMTRETMENGIGSIGFASKGKATQLLNEIKADPWVGVEHPHIVKVEAERHLTGFGLMGRKMVTFSRWEVLSVEAI